MDGIYPWAISLTPTTFCLLPRRFSFLFFSFVFCFCIFFPFMMTYCTTNVWQCNIVPVDSFSITNIWQGETDFKTLIFHQYFTWNLQSRCHVSLDFVSWRVNLFLYFKLSMEMRLKRSPYLEKSFPPSQRSSNETIVTVLSFKRDLMKNTILQSFSSL